MEYDGLGTLVNAAVGLTGLAMAVTGNDLDIPTGNNANNLSQDDKLIILQQDREKGYNAKMKLEEEKRLISKNLNSNPKSEIMSESKPQIELPENGL